MKLTLNADNCRFSRPDKLALLVVSYYLVDFTTLATTTKHLRDDDFGVKMVLLTMTQGMVEAIEKLQKLENNSLDPTKDKMRKHTQVPRAKDNAEFNTSQEGDGEATDDTKRAEDSHENAKSGGDDQIYTSRDADSRQRSKTESTIKEAQEPSLLNPKPGNPISHGQVVDLSRRLKSRNLSPSRLNVLLRGSRVYIPPPPPRPEPVSSYYFFGRGSMMTEHEVCSGI